LRTVTKEAAFEEKLLSTLQPGAEGKLSLEIRDIAKS
jgi:hypothetical protein